MSFDPPDRDYRGIVKRWLVLIAVGVLVVACSGGRPAMSEWAERWNETVASLPDPADVASLEDPRPLCDEVVATIRTKSVELVPTPDAALDGPVDAWVRVAEEMFFECPPRSGEIQGFDEGYGELAQYQAEVTAVING